MELNKKIEIALRLLRSIKEEEVEVCYSGGKDSDVILELAKMAGINYRAIYKKTTIDPPGTIQHCRKNNVEIISPKQTFFELIEQHGFPTRRARFCCSELKEYKVMDTSIQGIRRCESAKRAKNYKEPIICRIYGKKDNHVNVFLPILEWTDDNVEKFVRLRNIKCHPLYYRKEGEFNVKNRLGCLACPLKSDHGLSDFKEHPRLVKSYIKAGRVWWNKPRDKEIRSKEKFESIEDLFVHNVFFDNYESFRLAKSGLFGIQNCRDFLEKYFNINL
jgi:3'-phosphoadenosine 5'-phosphosulfate sulfotransferase (PAPS reductase)/FAD synthetase